MVTTTLDVVDALASALERSLRMAAGDASLTRLKDALPVLTLCMDPLNVRQAATAIERERQRTARLTAFAQLAAHAQTLGARPLAKRAFWLRVLSSEMADTSTSGVHECMLSQPTGPHYVIDFSDSASIDFDALHAFLTTPIATQHPRRPKIALGLSFPNCSLTLAQLRALAGVLDSVFAHPARQFAIDMLDLSDNWMGRPELAVVAAIVAKSVAHGVEELKLNNIVSDETADGSTLDATPPEYLDVLRAALGVRPVLAAPGANDLSEATAPLPRLKRLTTKGNDLCDRPFAVLGSALRYGNCAVDELLSTFVLQQFSHGSESERACWRWLAFGLFYPRPKRFARAQANSIRRIGPLAISRRMVTAVIATLQDPVAALLRPSESADSTESLIDAARVPSQRSSLIVCVLKPGACVELIRSTVSSNGQRERMALAPHCTELEALKERADGSVCVVVPGVGLGLVRRDDVVHIEHEPLTHAPLGQYDITLESQTVGAECERLFAVLGHQIRSLACPKSRFCDGALARTIAACPHLEHLNLDACTLTRADATALLQALESDLGKRLRSLNLNRLMLGDAFFRALAATLARTTSPLALQELRLLDTGISPEVLTELRMALTGNTTLEALELKHSSDPAHVALVAAFDDHVLRTRVALAASVGFLSVVRAKRDQEDSSALAALDPDLVSLVLAFAADVVTRRSFLHRVIGAPGRHA